MMDRGLYEELMRTDRNNAADRAKAAAVIAEECRDEEMAKALRLLSAQMDFDDNEEASDAIARNRENIDRMVADRSRRHADLYQKLITDEEILAISGGEVVNTDYDRISSSYVKNGLFDPDVFGGSGEIVAMDSTDKLPSKAFGLGMGHIELPAHVVLEEHYRLIAGLLDMNIEDVRSIVRFSRYVVLESEDEDVKVGTLLTEGERNELGKTVRVGMGGDAIHELLEGLNLPDHPERLAFKIIPVVSPLLRPMAFLKDEHAMTSDILNRLYTVVINRSNRCKKLLSLNAPDIILRNEKRMMDERVNELIKAIHDCYLDKTRSLPHDRNLRGYLLCQYTITMRNRRIGFQKVSSEKISEITSLNLYPKTIKVKEGKKIVDERFGDIIDSCCDTMNDYEREHAVETGPDGKLTKEQEKLCKEAAEHIDMLYDILHEIWKGAEEKREDFIVRWDQELDFYVPA